ncbi:MAG: CSLREA domain-containing protein, partial [Candidatus Binatus sp.]
MPLLFLAMSGLSRAATITVTTLADPTGARGTCSLRQAITNANGQNTAGSTNCSAGSGNNDQIIFASGLTGTITLGSTLPPITDTNLAIIGPTGSPG